MHKSAFHEGSIFVRVSETRKPLHLGEITPHAGIRKIRKRSLCHQLADSISETRQDAIKIVNYDSFRIFILFLMEFLEGHCRVER
jgi:hypothetical protein